VTGATWIGLHAFQWIALITAVLTLLVLADAAAGHYRSGFRARSQYVPFISGGLLIIAAVAAGLAPNVEWTSLALRSTGWLAVMSGLVGVGFHHYYGMATKPAGYSWSLHYLMYGAPQLAPMALTGTGLLALITASGLVGQTEISGVELGSALFVVVAVALIVAMLQAGILHYRGAFNNPGMYAPFAAPLLAVLACVWILLAPGPGIRAVLSVILWLTFLTGFVGLGMHLRGFGRQMGGLYVTIFNWLEGPPAFAPAVFTGFAAVGLVTLYLL
jgi:hypothetical protein